MCVSYYEDNTNNKNTIHLTMKYLSSSFVQ